MGKRKSDFNRVLLKISGEALMANREFGLDQVTVERVSHEIKAVYDFGVQICLVIGGGNIFRGISASENGMDRVAADYTGMLATVMNALALQDEMRRKGIISRVQSAINIAQVAEPYTRGKAMRHLELNRVVIFAAGIFVILLLVWL